MSKRRITASCGNCNRKFTDRDALDAHDCRETVYVGVTSGRAHRNPDCGHAPDTLVPRHESIDAPVCGHCKYWQMPAIEDHDDQDWLRQTGLGGSVASGQSTLDGGIRPSKRDRGQIDVATTLLFLAMMLAVIIGSFVFAGGVL